MKRALIFTGILLTALFANASLSFAEYESPNSKAGETENFNKILADKPVFESTSKEPILLRYKFKKG